MIDFEESLGEELAQLRQEGRWHPLTVLESPQDAEVEIGGEVVLGGGTAA